MHRTRRCDHQHGQGPRRTACVSQAIKGSLADKPFGGGSRDSPCVASSDPLSRACSGCAKVVSKASRPYEPRRLALWSDTPATEHPPTCMPCLCKDRTGLTGNPHTNEDFPRGVCKACCMAHVFCPCCTVVLACSPCRRPQPPPFTSLTPTPCGPPGPRTRSH